MKKIKQIYVYRDSHLPDYGWLQSCFCCYIITSKIKLFDVYEIKYDNLWELYIHLCPKCIKEMKNKIKYSIFLKKYKKYIYRYYPEIYILMNKKDSEKILQRWLLPS